ncbi:MAG: hypothetical protein LBT75_05600 [Bacilli bacterium]|jgi:hypothetical protein|nr:hypothetical protein [Bacilli bacterium]
MAILDKIKNIFVVEEEELDLKDFNTKENKELLYQNEVHNNSKKLDDIVLSEVKSDAFDQINPQEIKQPVEIIKEQPPLLNETDKHNFNFQNEINKAYRNPYVEESESLPLFDNEFKAAKQPKQVEQPAQKPLKKTSDLVNKENYVPRDILSPMNGVVKKHTVDIPKKHEEGKNISSEIIKIREFNKVVEVDDKLNDVLPFDLFEENTKKLDHSLSSLKDKKKSSLRDTSIFTLVEDSTGEMRLVIDEED